MLNIFHFIILLGAVQGIIVGSKLLLKEFDKNSPKTWLAIMMLSVSAILIRVSLIDVLKIQGQYPHLNFIYLVAPASIFYVLRITDSFHILRGRVFYYLIPFAIVNTVYVFLFFLNDNKEAYFQSVLSILFYDEILSLFFLGVSIFWCYKIILNPEKEFPLQLNNWIYQFVGMLLLMALIWGFYIISDYFVFGHQMELYYYYPLLILFSLILYYFSYQVISLKNVILEKPLDKKRKKAPITQNIEDQKMQELRQIIRTEKPYLENTLSLNELAKKIDVSPKVLSFIINKNENQNFNDFINKWRVEEVKKRIQQPDYKHLKLLSIALECGFNSKSTFNLAFKKATGMSPSEYQKKSAE